MQVQEKIEIFILIGFGLWFLIIVVVGLLLTKKEIKKSNEIILKQNNKYKLRDSIEPCQFCILDIFSFPFSDSNNWCILIRDIKTGTLYAYREEYFAYGWTKKAWLEIECSYLKPLFYDEPVLFDSDSQETYLLRFNKSGGQYKLIEELGHFEIMNDRLFLQYDNPKSKTISTKIKKIEHINEYNNMYNIHNVKFIECFVKFDRILEDKIDYNLGYKGSINEIKK